jgi:hypothetical protein
MTKQTSREKAQKAQMKTKTESVPLAPFCG